MDKEDTNNFNQLEQEATKLLAYLVMGESSNPNHPIDKTIEKEMPIQIIQKRINVLGLPIKLNSYALISSLIFSTNAGRAVVFLIDILRSLPNSGELHSKWCDKKLTEDDIKSIDLNYICENVYPFGVYKEEVFGDYIDNYLKPRKVNWSEIY